MKRLAANPRVNLCCKEKKYLWMRLSRDVEGLDATNSSAPWSAASVSQELFSFLMLLRF
jgi:uncharacterized pyridoxamine 5'-phosphate oxidase family protein